ncbi:3-oxoacyl-ACP reductase family protein [Segniliparus rugosus]|uniref:Ketoreductase domain-containing protein n=1 Tax=Segniliparus rugosus (strain ATCC BAA-974 / DSM 45345 / CCUG 50838 / CIP 108380 / JCM 13579 / CDC 945) TaxID=679197 RepID=E5XU28_SEGRC|nr:3-oxoacyl-ACP reductase family protein [Segniliparus rugosus]EFV12144.1 hypothetical protein HMPREF9336_03000 [Segniliparus rugosus ATCC BAA-974]
MESLQGKTALVTGGARGIGAGVVRSLVAAGAKVLFTYSNSEGPAFQLAESLGGAAEAFRADSALEADAERAVERAAQTFGGLDILVNNAGVSSISPLADLTSSEIDAMIDVNIRGVLWTTRAALKHIPDGGRIINIGSCSAERVPFPGISVYALSKGAIASFTKGLSRELGPRNITVNTIQPGPVETDMSPVDSPHAQTMLAAMALSRYGTVQEIGSFAVYLASDSASYITGANLTIDGGFSA